MIQFNDINYDCQELIRKAVIDKYPYLTKKKIIEYLKYNKLFFRRRFVISKIHLGRIEENIKYEKTAGEFNGAFYMEIGRCEKLFFEFLDNSRTLQIIDSTIANNQHIQIRKELVNKNWNLKDSVFCLADKIYLLIYNNELVGYEFVLPFLYTKLISCDDSNCNCQVWYDDARNPKTMKGTVDIFTLNGKAQKYNFTKKIINERKSYSGFHVVDVDLKIKPTCFAVDTILKTERDSLCMFNYSNFIPD